MSVQRQRKKDFARRRKSSPPRKTLRVAKNKMQASILMTLTSNVQIHALNNTLPPVPPWTGSTLYKGEVVRLRNTCTKNNWLAMFHFICTLYPTLVQANEDLFYQRITKNILMLENVFLANCTRYSCFLVKYILPSLTLTYLE